jgi:hypothetical protein
VSLFVVSCSISAQSLSHLELSKGHLGTSKQCWDISGLSWAIGDGSLQGHVGLSWVLLGKWGSSWAIAGPFWSHLLVSFWPVLDRRIDPNINQYVSQIYIYIFRNIYIYIYSFRDPPHSDRKGKARQSIRKGLAISGYLKLSWTILGGILGLF